MVAFKTVYKNIYKMKGPSITKYPQENTQSKSTNGGQLKSTNKDEMPKMKIKFKGLQLKLLNMFTIAKSQLTTIYQKIVSRIKKIEKSIQVDASKVNSTFWKIIEEIQLQAEQKINSMTQNIENTVTTPFLFDHLLSLFPDHCSTEYDMSSQKKINNSGSSSSNIKFIQKNNHIITDLDNVGLNEYKCAVRIKPNEKRIENLGCLTGKWDLLENITLQNKQIYKMIQFSTVMADSLQQINLSNNEISNLSFLTDADYPILRLLNLRKNLITSIDGIQTTKFPSLKILNLSENKIKNIQYLKLVNFPQLIQLNLSINKIQKPDIFCDCDFPKLEILNLDNNNIQSIQFLPNCAFYRLKILSFCYNQIKIIDCLKKCKLQKLQALLGYNNKICSIECLSSCDFPMLKQIILNNNLIDDISVVSRMKFKKLSEFDLQNNKLRPKQICCFVIKNDQCVKARKIYPFIQL